MYSDMQHYNPDFLYTESVEGCQ